MGLKIYPESKANVDKGYPESYSVSCDRCEAVAPGTYLSVRDSAGYASLQGWFIYDYKERDLLFEPDCLSFCPDCTEELNIWETKEESYLMIENQGLKRG